MFRRILIPSPFCKRQSPKPGKIRNWKTKQTSPSQSGEQMFYLSANKYPHILGERQICPQMHCDFCSKFVSMAKRVLPPYVFSLGVCVCTQTLRPPLVVIIKTKRIYIKNTASVCVWGRVDCLSKRTRGRLEKIKKNERKALLIRWTLLAGKLLAGFSYSSS